MTQAHQTLDCFGLLCPMPVFKTAAQMEHMGQGQVLEVLSTDPAVEEDMAAWCMATGHALIAIKKDGGEYRLYVRKS
ncbi:MAG: sulfurtransferase TusA family protein [Candidatus Omnitrophica bacterium]|nr:sulfurtransferase TusA family protein [Candidatus Omnitrophota bacterium]